MNCKEKQITAKEEKNKVLYYIEQNE